MNTNFFLMLGFFFLKKKENITKMIKQIHSNFQNLRNEGDIQRGRYNRVYQTPTEEKVHDML
jgi:ribosomal protein L19E